MLNLQDLHKSIYLTAIQGAIARNSRQNQQKYSKLAAAVDRPLG
ncbi:MAG: hypothetical protein WBL95_04135 [Microcoleus sp.]